MSIIAQSSPCVRHSTIIDSEDSREPVSRLTSEVQLLDDKSEVLLEPLSDNSDNSVEPTCNGSEKNVVYRNFACDKSLKPPVNSSSDYIQRINDDHNYLQLASNVPNSSSLQRTREGSGSCLLAVNELEAYLQLVEPNLNSYRQHINERPLGSNDHIRPNNSVYAEQAEYDQIADVAMAGYQPPDNTRSRSQQYSNLVCDLHIESSFESTSSEQPRHVQNDVVLPADETP